MNYRFSFMVIVAMLLSASLNAGCPRYVHNMHDRYQSIIERYPSNIDEIAYAVNDTSLEKLADSIVWDELGIVGLCRLLKGDIKKLLIFSKELESFILKSVDAQGNIKKSYFFNTITQSELEQLKALTQKAISTKHILMLIKEQADNHIQVRIHRGVMGFLGAVMPIPFALFNLEYW